MVPWSIGQIDPSVWKQYIGINTSFKVLCMAENFMKEEHSEFAMGKQSSEVGNISVG